MRLALLSSLALLLWLMSGCLAGKDNKPAAINGPATHTGTGVMLRVDTYEGLTHDGELRFIPMRHKGYMSKPKNSAESQEALGYKPEITKDDWIRVSIRSAFIRYLDEWGRKKRKGEVIMLISFHAGSVIRDEGYVVYSSKGQTLSSGLNINDWPVVGPVQVDSENFLMRIVVMEVDSHENQQLSKALNLATDAAAAIDNRTAMVKRVAQESIDLLIALNEDDIIMDERFGLRRMPSETETRINYTPLLEGTYALLHQEDSLQGEDVSKMAATATMPPNVDRIRFDRQSHRLYYKYQYVTDNNATIYEDYRDKLYGAYELDSYDFGEDLSFKSRTVTKEGIVKQLARKDMTFCGDDLMKPEKGNRAPLAAYVSGNFEDTLKQIYADTSRGVSYEKRATFLKELKKRCEQLGKCGFEFPVVVYPKCKTMLVQYPFHTHVVFSIERARDGYEKAYHDMYDNYSKYMEEFFKGAINEDGYKSLRLAMNDARETIDRQKKLFSNLEKQKDPKKRIAALKTELATLKGGDGKNKTSTYDDDSIFIRTVEDRLSEENMLEASPALTKLKDIAPKVTGSTEGAEEYYSWVVARRTDTLFMEEALLSLSRIFSREFVAFEQYEAFVKKSYLDRNLVSVFSKSNPKDMAESFLKELKRADRKYKVAIQVTDELKNLEQKMKVSTSFLSVEDVVNWLNAEKEKQKVEALKQKMPSENKGAGTIATSTEG